MLEDICGLIISITCSVKGTWLCSWYSDLPHCIMKWDWGQGAWTGPFVCWGEGVIGASRFGLLEGGSPLSMERKERRAGQSQPLGIRVELEWPAPRIRWLPKSSTGIQSRTFFVKVRLDGFSRTCDAGYFDPVPTQYHPAVQKPLIRFLCFFKQFPKSGWSGFAFTAASPR